MTQVLELKQKQRLTFDDICPLWSEEIKSGNRNLFLNIGEPCRCIVGEAQKFNGSYYNEDKPEYCYVCKDMCRLLPDIMHKVERRDELIDAFVDHWNDKHAC